MSDHTKGKWYVSKLESGGIGIKPIPGQVICVMEPKQEANAPLIASAPDLLEALKHAQYRLNMIPHNYDDTDFAMIREAIQKAEGE